METGNNLIWILIAVNAIGMPAIINYLWWQSYASKRNTEKIEEHDLLFEKIQKRIDAAEMVRHQDNEKFTMAFNKLDVTLTEFRGTVQNLADKINFNVSRTKGFE